jgi:GTP-binding protein Era
VPETHRSGIVAVVGRPNAGKSTLVNRIVGRKVAIVSDKPQTTRKRLLGVLTRPDFQAAFVDTPGIHRPEHRMNAAMVRDALDALNGCDVVLVVADATERIGRGTRFVFDAVVRSRAPAVLALNKIDRMRKPALLPLLADYAAMASFRALVPVSALHGDGVEDLLGEIEALLPEGGALYPEGDPSPGPLADKIAEQIREPALAMTREEIPHALAVVVDEVRTSGSGGLTVVTASLVVEREGQKGILVGKGGAMIRAIGSAARRACEQRFGGRFYLDLSVRTRGAWREDERFLSQIVNPDV